MSRFLYGPGRAGFIAPIYVGGMETPPNQGTQALNIDPQRTAARALSLIPPSENFRALRRDLTTLSQGNTEQLTDEEARDLINATQNLTAAIVPRNLSSDFEEEQREETERGIARNAENFAPSEAEAKKLDEQQRKQNIEETMAIWQEAYDKVVGKILLDGKPSARFR